jgi:transposase
LIRLGARSMAKPYSTDLRERAVEAVETGASRREAAEIFKLSVSSVIRWCQLWSETGSAEPKRSGGSTSPLEEHSDWLLALIAKQPDLTLKEILAAMAKQRIRGSQSALQRFFDRHNVSYKKKSARGRAKASRRRSRPPTLETRARHA